ncbi:hypothetical protein CCACVL1_24284 [Corchorus capsularis]|uniref:Uncharacterized protein n=1 Tax=Corchorus capsularis TaxID=210143 RepID=A0A1R3GQD9_COCAP|nr:hypothetical protein CCACVL1_24284 [Corchorus capsularis]
MPLEGHTHAAYVFSCRRSEE